VEGLHHQWVLHRLETVKEDTDAALAGYRFNDMAQGLYKFLWNEFCDWYLELVKPDMREEGVRKQAAQFVLWTVLRETLVLLHPIMPFVSAEIWQALPGGAGGDLALELFPPSRPGCRKAEEAGRMDCIQEVIVAVRTMRAELGISPAKKLACILRPADAAQLALFTHNRGMIEVLARLEKLDIGQEFDIPRASASGVAQGCEIVVPLAGAVDLASELARLDKELAGLAADLAVVQKKLANRSFVERAPAEVVNRERERSRELDGAREKLVTLRRRFADAMQG
jgi:valyl-tRNA synthetase